MLAVLDEAARPLVRQAAFDELFVGQTPVLMGVEPASFCWLLGEVAARRDGPTWAGHFAQFPALEHAITDAGTGLAKGLALANQQRRASRAELVPPPAEVAPAPATTDSSGQPASAPPRTASAPPPSAATDLSRPPASPSAPPRTESVLVPAASDSSGQPASAPPRSESVPVPAATDSSSQLALAPPRTESVPVPAATDSSGQLASAPPPTEVASSTSAASGPSGKPVSSSVAAAAFLRPPSRETPLIEQSLDVFHTQREGSRAWRVTEARLWKLHDQAQRLWKPLRRRREQGLSLQGRTQTAQQAERRAEAALEEAVRCEAAWERARLALEFFTPEGRLNTVATARAVLTEALPQLAGETWAKTVRLLEQPESLTFLERLERQLRALALPAELREDALCYEGLCRQPGAREGEDAASRGRRAWWLVATVRYARDEEFRDAVTAIRRVLRDVWRASSLVEGINSVARMQQARHRKLTPGLVSLKRLYWNCREFRTGPRRHRTPYELLGLTLPTSSWWELLKMSPDDLKQKLSTSSVAP